MDAKPLISVILPVFNAQAHLRQAIDSILAQSYANFELIILDDGSTDNSPDIVTSYKDERILYKKNLENKGLIHQLNEGLALAKGKYIARMDADDYSLPTRFERQLQFLEANTQYAIVGGQVGLLFGNSRSPRGSWQYDTTWDDLQVRLLFAAPFCHPAVMMRTEVVRQFRYSPDYYVAEDYHLWSLLLQKYRGTNLKKRVLNYRIHETSEGATKKVHQKLSVEKIYTNLLLTIFDEKTVTDNLHLHILATDAQPSGLSVSELLAVEKWLLYFYNHLINNNLYNKKSIQKIFEDVWWRVCWKSKETNGFKTLQIYYKSNFFNIFAIKKLIKLCLVAGFSPIFLSFYRQIRNR